MDPIERSDGGEARTALLLEETILPTPHSTDLLRSSGSDYILRLDSRTRNVAELFQENTKLTPYTDFMGPSTEHTLSEARKFYFSTPYRLLKGAVDPEMVGRLQVRHAEMGPAWERLLAPFQEKGPLCPLLYSLDLLLIHERRLLRVIPQSDVLWIERRVKPSEPAAQRAAMLRLPAEALAQVETFLFVAAAPWRYMMFLGPRGYRHMMFEAGNLIAQLQFMATQLKLNPMTCLDFYDVRVDGLLAFDGTERTTLAIIGLKGGAS